MSAPDGDVKRSTSSVLEGLKLKGAWNKKWLGRNTRNESCSGVSVPIEDMAIAADLQLSQVCIEFGSGSRAL